MLFLPTSKAIYLGSLPAGTREEGNSSGSKLVLPAAKASGIKTQGTNLRSIPAPFKTKGIYTGTYPAYKNVNPAYNREKAIYIQT